MAQRIVIRHLGGSKAQQVEEFPLDGFKELVIGRDPSASLKYDPNTDDLVSRTHAKIVRDPEESTTFTIIDQNSSNGTYLNKRRLAGPANIAPGDIIQLGPGGPEFQFDLDPRPQESLRHTRVATDQEVSSLNLTPFPSTRIGDVPPPPPSSSVSSTPPAMGRATVERLIEAGKFDTRKYLVNGGAALLGVIILVAGLFLYRERTTQQTLTTIRGQVGVAIKEATSPALTTIKEVMAPEDIAKTYGSSTVLLESGWKLIDTSTGKQVFHRHISTKKGRFPAYLLIGDSIVEPWLVTDDENGVNPPVGGSGLLGSGFVVTEDGFLLTNRHVAAPWETQWGGAQPPSPGILYKPVIKQGKLQFAEVEVLKTDSSFFSSLLSWVPAKSKQLGGKPELGKFVEGRHDYFDVTFPKIRSRIPGRLVRVSDSADVSLVKIDMPQSLTKVQMLDNYDSITAGKVVTVLGYPVVSPFISVRIKSQDAFSPEDHWKVVPDPTVTTGSLGRIIRGEATPAGGTVYDYKSELGDLYQLTVNATGPGNSGGPVFDDHGKVIGIYSSIKSDDAGTRISFAVPIKYGMDLMGLKTILR